MRSPESRPGFRPGKTFEEELNLRYLSPGAFTILSSNDNGVPPDPPQAPLQYRLSPTSRRHKNQSFAIIAEPAAQARSRSPSPTGRVSPFRGRGFNPVGSRHQSPAPSPPPEDSRIGNHQYKQNRNHNSNNNVAAKRSQIPLLRRRSSSVLYTDDSDSSPKFRRKNASNLKPQLSKSLNYIGPKNVSYKPPPSPRRHGGLYTTKGNAFNRLSPIIGSSPEPGSDTKSLSSPSRIPTSRSTPGSRKHSPSRDLSPDYKRTSRHTSRVASRNSSRNASRDSSPSAKPPITPTKIPVRNYKNVQAKVNSYNAKTNSTNKAKVPNKTQEIRNKLENNNNKTKLNRAESVSKLVSKNNSSSTSNLAKNSNKTVSSTNLNKTTSSSNLNKSSTNLPKTGSTTNLNKTPDKKKPVTNSNVKKNLNNTPTTTNKTTKNDDKNNNNSETSSKASDDDFLKKVESIPKLTDMMPSDLVSTTTSAVTKPLKIEAKLDTPLKEKKEGDKPKIKETPMYMDEGRILSATSVSSAMERMNDTVLDSQTLLKDHNISKLSPNATAVITLANESNNKSATSGAVPNVETTTTGQNQNSHNVTVNNSTVKTNINKLISPDDNFGVKVNNLEKSANERIVEARTMVTSDVKPIKIMVQEKGNDSEVQSGNVRFPPNATNGSLNSGPPRISPHESQSEHSSDEKPPKSKCKAFMDKCKDKLKCGCCKKEPKPPVTVEIEDETKNAKSGCFGCLKKSKADLDDIIIKDAEDDEEDGKKSCLDRLKSCCCRSNKVGDSTTGCCGRGKRKDSWVDRRDSILSAPVPLTRSEKCKNFFKTICCCLCCGSMCKRKSAPKVEEVASRRASMFSKKKSLTPTVLPPEEPKNKLDSSLVEYTSTMKAAIPVLPVFLAYFCLFFNIFAPGTGTIFSGLFCLCMGKPRFSPKDGPKPRIGSFIINAIIGCGQFFTVLFCLVGWGWSIWWGVIMVKLAKKYKKLKLIEERLEAEKENEKAGTSENRNDKDVEKGRS